jgi:hypothetical protein
MIAKGGEDEPKSDLKLGRVSIGASHTEIKNR